MPAALDGTDHAQTAIEISADAVDDMAPEMAETFRFLAQVQQQAIATQHPKIASFAFPIAPIAPWQVLSALGNLHQRHFYYDSPQQWALVGLDVVVSCEASGADRFSAAQRFTKQWQHQFLHAKTNSKADLPGRFFCSATFFESTSSESTSSEVVSSEPASEVQLATTARSAAFSPDSFEPIYIFVPQIQVMTLAEGSNVTFNYLIETTTDIAQTAQTVFQQRQQIEALSSLAAAQSEAGRSHPSKLVPPKTVSKDVTHFEPAVTGALSQLRQGALHKVVLADVMDVVAPQAIDVVRSLQTLRQNHPDCTVFSVGNGRGQSFIGASPERLLSINEGRLTTDALAGSASRGNTPEADAELAQALLNSEKERYEHQVVVEFIAQQLRSLNLDPDYAPAPHLLRLFHIQHLHTPMSAQFNPEKISPLDILAKLHPTPAVAGLPLQSACQLIHQHETFERGLYAAPIGWIDTKGNSEFIVGIRSALVDGHSARLYAGAGIVAGSEPKKELAEIKLKLQTLLNALV
ncbi:MAG: isochorismate synthase [Cyanobacteria bacterium J06632_3]